MRLDVFLATQAEVKSRSVAQRMIDDGNVRLNNKVVRKSSHQLKKNDTIYLEIIPGKNIPQTAADSHSLSPILYEDADCLIIDKLAGMVVHPGAGMKDGEVTVLDVVRGHFTRQALPFSESEVLVHRLDKETTGCLLVAKHQKAHMALQKLFATRQIHKTYLALVAGVPSPVKALIDSPIGRHAIHRTKMSVTQTAKARSAKTSYSTVDARDQCALLACELFTGRTHQIRVHLSSIGHPILGDPKYCTKESRELSRLLGINFMCLHAWKLAFISPLSGKHVQVSATIGDQWRKCLEKLGLMVSNT